MVWILSSIQSLFIFDLRANVLISYIPTHVYCQELSAGLTHQKVRVDKLPASLLRPTPASWPQLQSLRPHGLKGGGELGEDHGLFAVGACGDHPDFSAGFALLEAEILLCGGGEVVEVAYALGV